MVYTLEEIVDKTILLINLNSIVNIKESLLSAKREDLISYHFTLGRLIRNHFHLWNCEWEPLIVNGVDYSDEHPDNLSMKIITLVWEKINLNEK